VLQSAASGEARFDYDPSTLAPRGLLIEEQRSNLVSWSEEFDNADWLKTNSSVTPNTIVAPDGTTTADTLTANTNSGQIQQSRTGTAGVIYTVSIWIRRRTGTGQVSLRSVENVNTPITVTSDWQRFSLAVTSTTTTIRCGVFLAASGDAVDIWGAQLEAGAFPTSYIPTTTTALTRNADVASMTGTNFSDWYNASEGTIFANYSRITTNTTYAQIISLDDGSLADRISLSTSGGSGYRFRIDVVDNSISQWQNANVGEGTQFPISVIAAYKINDFAATLNGGAVQTNTSGTVPTINQLVIGNRAGGNAFLNGHIRRIAYYPTRLSNAQLQALTA
jgi:hypothetical protein